MTAARKPAKRAPRKQREEPLPQHLRAVPRYEQRIIPRYVLDDMNASPAWISYGLSEL